MDWNILLLALFPLVPWALARTAKVVTVDWFAGLGQVFEPYLSTKEREKLPRFTEFQAFQECPKCQDFSHALIGHVGRKKLRRVCRKCSHTWTQTK